MEITANKEVHDYMKALERLKTTLSHNCALHKNARALSNSKCSQCYYDEQQQKARAEQLERIRNKKSQAGIGERFINSTFDNYIIQNDRQQAVIDKLQKYELQQDILMLGSIGTGKTHLSCSIAHKMLLNGYSVAYIKFYKLAKLRFNENEYKKLEKVDFLIIDEIGIAQTESKNSSIFELIDERYDNDKKTCLVSNLNTVQFKELISHATYSRLKENSMVVVSNWDDFRINKNS